jgi:hypothetical protein
VSYRQRRKRALTGSAKHQRFSHRLVVFAAVPCLAQKEAPDATGSYAFYGAASTLLLASNVVFWSLCFIGGAARDSMHPEAGLALPKMVAAAVPLDCTLTQCECVRKVARALCDAVTKLGPA